MTITQDKIDNLERQMALLNDEMMDNLPMNNLSNLKKNNEVSETTKKKVKLKQKHRLKLECEFLENYIEQHYGKNTIFQTRNNSCYFLLDIRNQKIVTNNEKLKDIQYVSNTKSSNHKYIMSKFVWGVMVAIIYK